MKAIIEFNFPEDQEEFNEMVSCKDKAKDYNIRLCAIRNFVRSKIKYTDLTENEEKLLIEIRDMIPNDLL